MFGYSGALEMYTTGSDHKRALEIRDELQKYFDEHGAAGDVAEDPGHAGELLLDSVAFDICDSAATVIYTPERVEALRSKIEAGEIKHDPNYALLKDCAETYADTVADRSEKTPGDLLEFFTKYFSCFVFGERDKPESPRGFVVLEPRDTLEALRVVSNLRPVKAKNLVLLNTYAAAKLPAFINRGEVEIITGRKKSKNPTKETIAAAIVPRTVDGVTIEGRYNEAVFSAVLSLYLAGNNPMTPEMVARFLGTDPRKEHVEKIRQDIKTLENMDIKIDCRAEAERRGWDLSRIEGLAMGEKMLRLRYVFVKMGGIEKEAFFLTEDPALYVHAQQSGEIVTKKAALLTIRDQYTGKTLHSNEARASIVVYLLQQLGAIQADQKRARTAYQKNERKHKEDPEAVASYPVSHFRKFNEKNHILYDTVFERVGLSDLSRSSAINYKSFIKNCFATWKDAGEIEGWRELFDTNRKDRARGIELFLK